MGRVKVWLVALAAVGALLLASGVSGAAPHGTSAVPSVAACSSGYVDAHLSWGEKCLRAGEFCTVGNAEYHAYGFDCPASGHLTYYSAPAPAPTTTSSPPPTTTTDTTVDVGATVLLKRRTKTSGCKLGANPDRRCSPGAYYSGLTQDVLCSPSFRTGTIRNVPQSEKYAVEREYGLKAKLYGHTLEIDHIVSLELGGSNDIANLYPEEAKFSNGAPGFGAKDKLENKLHDLVCSGAMSLRAAQRGIASNWERLYKKVYGVTPVRRLAK